MKDEDILPNPDVERTSKSNIIGAGRPAIHLKHWASRTFKGIKWSMLY